MKKSIFSSKYLKKRKLKIPMHQKLNSEQKAQIFGYEHRIGKEGKNFGGKIIIPLRFFVEKSDVDDKKYLFFKLKDATTSVFK